MKDYALGFDLSVLDVNFVAAKYNRYVFANPDQIAMPVWYVFVGDARRNVKHDDGALSLNVVTVAKAAKFLLTGGIPNVEAYRSAIGMENQRMHFHAQSRHILFFKFSRQVALDERRFTGTPVAD